MNALILAAGLGTRLRPLTNDRPKALVEVNGKTLLEHNILKLRAAGFDHIVVNIHHFGDQIVRFLAEHNNFDTDIRISDERDLLLDTGGALLKAFPLFPDDNPVLIHNVDIVSDVDVSKLYRSHATLEEICRAVGLPLPGATLFVGQRTTSRYLLFDYESLLRGWTNVSTGEVKGQQAPVRRAFSGLHVVSHTILPYLERCNARRLKRQSGEKGILFERDLGPFGEERRLSGENVSPSGEKPGSTEETTEHRICPFSIMDFYLSVCNELPLHGEELPEGSQWVDCGKVESLEKAAKILP